MNINTSFALFALLAIPGLSQAHIDLERAGTHVAKFAQGERGADTKMAPCGNPDGIATGASYTYQPGETITLSVAEYVSHPGYFRIAFDNDGDDDFLDPRWIVAQDPNRDGGCPIDENDQCRPGNPAEDGDFFNNATVLMDYLNPHLRGTAATYTWQLTLPDVECDNCTLQVIQVMEDPARGFHGVYNTSPGDNNDVYHQCVAIKLQRT
ncbi:MAG: hypothetical protein RQ899_00280 [Pseudomonadales bacterium]|nr:hypothetical protein [Pseudomonadales bacterium]